MGEQQVSFTLRSSHSFPSSLPFLCYPTWVHTTTLWDRGLWDTTLAASPYQYSQNIFPNPAFICLENSMSIKSSIGNSTVSFKMKCDAYILKCFSCTILLMWICMVSWLSGQLVISASYGNTSGRSFWWDAAYKWVGASPWELTADTLTFSLVCLWVEFCPSEFCSQTALERSWIFTLGLKSDVFIWLFLSSRILELTKCCLAWICLFSGNIPVCKHSSAQGTFENATLKPWNLGRWHYRTFSFSHHSTKNDIVWVTPNSSWMTNSRKIILAWFVQALQVCAGRCWQDAFDAAANDADWNGDDFPFGFHEKIHSRMSVWEASLRLIFKASSQGWVTIMLHQQRYFLCSYVLDL